MTKQEQIDEIAKIIDDRLIEANRWLGSMNRGEGYWIAQKLVEHYQPKLSEDSVVLSREEWKQIKNSLYYSKEELEKKLQRERKETAEKFAKLIEFHSISKRDESGYETFTISNLCMREILREQFGFTNEELETMWEIKE